MDGFECAESGVGHLGASAEMPLASKAGAIH